MVKKQTATWVLLVFLALLWHAREASAYGGVSGLSYNSSSDQLSGYTATWKDWWDGDYSDCLYWDYDWEYEQWYCASWGYWQNRVAVNGYVYAPSGSTYASGSMWGWSYAEWDLSPSTPSENGTWTIGGDHYQVQVMYISDGWYWYYAGTWTNYLGSTAWQENVLPCGDERGTIIQEYVTYNVNLRPTCSDFTQSVPASSHYSFGQWNSGTYSWAILRDSVVANTFCVVSNYGSVPNLNSGYRNPARNAQVSDATNSRHVYGDAADLSAPNQSQWNTLRNIGKNGVCSVACVEPRSLTPTWYHGDYRGVCPTGW